jgi:hypothetical protein
MRLNVVRGRKLALKYLQGWFTVDLLSTIPFDHLVRLFSHSSSDSAILRSTKVRVGTLHAYTEHACRH